MKLLRGFCAVVPNNNIRMSRHLGDFRKVSHTMVVETSRNRHTGTVKDPLVQARLETLLAQRGDLSKDTIIGRIIERGVMAGNPDDPSEIWKRIEQTLTGPVISRLARIEAMMTKPAVPFRAALASRCSAQLDHALEWTSSRTGTLAYVACVMLIAGVAEMLTH